MIQKDVSRLSKNEQKVLYYLVRYPNRPDREIYNMIQMKQSTYSTIKKNLAKEGYYYTSYAPIMQHLGCELLVVWYLTLNRRTRTEDRLALTREKLMATSDIFTTVSESNQAIIFSISKNIGQHIRVSDEIVQLYEENNFLEDIHYVLFPFEVSSIFSFFDFSPLLNRIFKIEPPEAVIGDVDVHSDKVKCKVKHVGISELEKKVFLGLIQFPGLSDSLLCEKVGCSRQVFRRLKYRLLEERLIKKRRIVSLEKLGFDILAMTHSTFNPLKPLHERETCVRNIASLRTPIFNIARDPESVMLTAFRDFKEFKYLHNEFVSFCAEHDTLRGEPVTFLLSIPRIFEVKWLVYEPLVRKILEDL